MTHFTETELRRLLASNIHLALMTDDNHMFIEPRQLPQQNIHSEHDLQAAVIAECEKRAVANPLWGMIFAIPNGGQRTKAAGGKLKAEGVKAGVPDLFLPVARHNAHGMFIEMKFGSGKPSQAQIDWKRSLIAQGYLCHVIWDSVEETIELIQWYLESKGK